LYSSRSANRTGLRFDPATFKGALTLTGPPPGVYNLFSVGGAFLVRHPTPPRLRESKLQPIGTACRNTP